MAAGNGNEDDCWNGKGKSRSASPEGKSGVSAVTKVKQLSVASDATESV